MKIKKYSFYQLMLVLITCSIINTSQASPVSIQKKMISGNTKWSSAFDLDYSPQEITIKINISLLAPKNLNRPFFDKQKVAWLEAINNIWNKQFYALIDGKKIPIIVNVRFTHFQAHHRVVIHPGKWIPNQHNWYINSPALVIAHEVGHMLGAYDEYRGGALSTQTHIIDSTSIMGSKPLSGSAYPRHFLLIENSLKKLLRNKQITIQNL